MQPEEASGTSTPVVEAEDLDFSDLKKKKKSAKKVAFDMEEFEKQLSHSKTKDGEEKGEDEEGEETAPVFDEKDLGEDIFAHGEAPVLDAGTEPWLGSDRDYTYAEVSRNPNIRPVSQETNTIFGSYCNASTPKFTHQIQDFFNRLANGLPSRPHRSCAKARSPSSPTLLRSVGVCIGSQSTSSSICSQKWVRQDQ